MPDLHVLLPAPNLPTLSLWQATLNALHLPVTLDPAFSPVASPIGPFPASLPDRPPTSFDFLLSPTPTLTAAYPGLKGMFPHRPLVATFRFGPADPAQTACALCALAALAHLTQSPWFDPREGACFPPESALTHARIALSFLPPTTPSNSQFFP